MDVGNKKALCAMLGVTEYFMFDPEADVLKPPLAGYRLRDGDYAALAPDAEGALTSVVLGVRLRVDDSLQLRVHDAASGTQLLRPEQLGDALDDAERRIAALERDLERVRRG
jgi:hypothetical protein